ncbi:C25 family cysteine peptidase [Wenzhouxiangella sediminis]|nr:C25 family cysteine peptidase [Wenzhouxiangella sediminis]
MPRSIPSIVAMLLGVAALFLCSWAQAGTERFRIYIDEDGVYRLPFELLQATGLQGPVARSSLRLANRGQAVDLWFGDDPNERFGPGDSLHFVASRIRNDAGHRHDYSSHNVYVLDTAALPAQDPHDASNPMSASTNNRKTLRPVSQLHFEEDLLRVPVSGRTDFYPEGSLWYWKQINHLVATPTQVPIDLSHFRPDGDSTLTLGLRFLGGSDSARYVDTVETDHAIEIGLNGRPLGTARWNGRTVHEITFDDLPGDIVEPEGNVVELKIPARIPEGGRDPVVDVIYLDWIKARFPRDDRIGSKQALIRLPAFDGSVRMSFRASEGEAIEQLDAYTDDGHHLQLQPGPAETSGQVLRFSLDVAQPVDSLWLVPNGNYRAVDRVERDRTSSLRQDVGQRDYFIIAHASLLDPVAPLARFHSSRGMRTELIDVQDIYDEFNHGIAHPKAIREFLAHAREHRDGPPASHVLLVGDANWFIGPSAAEALASGQFDTANLMPTWQLRSRDGPAASDHPYVMLEGEDLVPDMAIGRFPARNAAEARAMVDKTIRYMTSAPPGEWRSRVLLVSDDARNLSARNTRLRTEAESAGFHATELLPGDKTNPLAHQAALRSAIDRGALLLHFFGHGGRYMWQTTGSAGGGSGNLFDMSDLDELQPSGRLPIVLSMSCNTGPFDHPSADSLAEKFMRMGDRGAAAVLAASARNSPSLKFTKAIMTGILAGETLGDAIRAAKSGRLHQDSYLLYNLFGDPALVPARPMIESH